MEMMTMNATAPNSGGDSLSAFLAWAWEWLGMVGMSLSKPDFLSAFQISLGVAGTALLTIFIPLAIASFNDNKRGDNFYDLDRHISLDYIFRGYWRGIPRIVISVGCIFTPLILSSFIFLLPALWALFLIPMLCIWGVGIYHIIGTITDIYGWLNENNKFTRRFDFLREAKPTAETVIYWKSVWQVETKHIGLENERKLIVIFFSKIESLKGKKDNKHVRIMADLLVAFDEFIDKRWPFWLANNEVLPRILSWFHAYLDSPLHAVWSPLQRILTKITEKAIADDVVGVGFYPHFKNHLDSEETNQPEHYMYYITGILFSALVRCIENSKERIGLRWGNEFPDEWKITRENLADGKNVVAGLFSQHYFDWMGGRIRPSKERKYDSVLDDVTNFLFPDIDTTIWAYLVSFLFTSYNPKIGKAATAIQEKPVFGRRSGIRPVVGYSMEAVNKKADEIHKQAEENTLMLVIGTFLNSRSELEDYVNQLNALKGIHPDDSREEYHRKLLLEFCKKMLKMTKPKGKKPNPPKK